MIEILFLAKFGRTLAAMSEAKGRSAWWAAMGVGAWIFGEVFGFVVGTLLGLDALAYVCGLGCAAVCALVAYLVVRNLDNLFLQPTIAQPKGARSPSGAPTAGTNISVGTNGTR